MEFLIWAQDMTAGALSGKGEILTAAGLGAGFGLLSSVRRTLETAPFKLTSHAEFFMLAQAGVALTAFIICLTKWNIQTYVFLSVCSFVACKITLVPVKKVGGLYLCFKHWRQHGVFEMPPLVVASQSTEPQRTKIDVAQAQLVVQLPAGAERVDFETAPDYRKSNRFSHPSWQIASAKWCFHSDKDVFEGWVRFTASIQRPTDFGDLLQPLPLRSAIERQIFTEHFLEREIQDASGFLEHEIQSLWWMNEKPVVRASDVVIIDWKQTFDEHRWRISYWLDSSKNIFFQHIGLDSNHILTIRIEKLVSEKADQSALRMIDQLRNSCQVPHQDNSTEEFSRESQHIMALASPSPCKLSTTFPQMHEFIASLARRAADPLEWFVFKNSELFQPWIDRQYKNALSSYRIKEQAYIEGALASHLDLVKESTVTRSTGEKNLTCRAECL